MLPTAAPPGPRSILRPEPGEIELWWLDLDNAERMTLDSVSAAERERALAMRHPRESARRLAASGLVRVVLAGYEGRPAAELPLSRDARGHQMLSGSGLRFSVSHAGSLGAIAVGRGRELGIDVEPISAARQIAEVADAYLPPERSRAVRSTRTRDRDRGWVALWTEVEARAKMTGDGIGNLSPREAARLLAMPAIVALLIPSAGFLGTLAYNGPPARLRIRSLADREDAT